MAVKKELEERQQNVFADIDGKCENISALAVQLQRLLVVSTGFVLVFDAIDKQREAHPTLLPALARLGELVCITSERIYARLTEYRSPV